MQLNRDVQMCAWFLSAVLLLMSSHTLAVDCNNNGVEDELDIQNGTSEDCDLNRVPDECQPDSNGNGIIDACDNCGLQLTDNNEDDFFSFLQPSTSRGHVIWFDIQDDVYLYDGTTTQLIQPRVVNSVDLEGVANFVFGMGTGANPDEVLAAWRRGTDFAWVWANDGQGMREVTYTNPYDPARAMNPEDVAIADGCIFMLLQAFDPATSNLALHVARIDPDTGDATLLTGDFLDVTQNEGPGAEVRTLVTSGCMAAWAWCSEGIGGACFGDRDLHFYDGAVTTAIDVNARPLSFARGRLIYSKEVGGVDQLFLYDANLANPAPVQITSFLATDKEMVFAQSDGRNVAMLMVDENNQDPELMMLGGLRLTDAATQPTETPNKIFPFRMNRGQLLWTAQTTSVIYYDGQTFQTVCSDGWLADGYLAQLRRSSATGTDTEVFLFTGTMPDDAEQPSAPMLVEVMVPSNRQAMVSWSTVLGATSYNVYFARQTGVNPMNYESLAGGGAVMNATGNSATVDELDGDQLYYFVVTAVENGTEGPVSQEVTATPCFDPTLDSDNDGTPDCMDGCPDDPAKTEPGACGCGVPDTDSNGNGIPDCLDDDGSEPPDDGNGPPDDGSEPPDDGSGPPDDGNGSQDGPGCAPGLCGPGVVPILPLMLFGMAVMRRACRRGHR